MTVFYPNLIESDIDKMKLIQFLNELAFMKDKIKWDEEQRKKAIEEAKKKNV